LKEAQDNSKSISVDQRHELAKKVREKFLESYSGQRKSNVKVDYSNVDFFFSKLRF
jgi:hypothetical protein